MTAFLTAKQRIEEFDVRHGMDAINVNGRLIFSDGAIREEDPMGLLQEPPADPYECNRIRLHYHEVKLQRAVRKFENCKSQLLARIEANRQNPRTAFPPGQEEIDQLDELRSRVKELQETVNRVKQETEDSKPEEMVRREKQMAETARRNEEAAQKIKTINI